jgi:hypothetical protein
MRGIAQEFHGLADNLFSVCHANCVEFRHLPNYRVSRDKLGIVLKLAFLISKKQNHMQYPLPQQNLSRDFDFRKRWHSAEGNGGSDASPQDLSLKERRGISISFWVCVRLSPKQSRG